MTRRSRFSQEARERAVRMVLDHGSEYGSRWEAISSIAEKIGCAPETLRKWLLRAEVDSGPAMNDDVMKRMRPLVLVTDVSFILYWSVSLLILLGFEVVPEAWLFKDYDNPIIYAWNWSFFPLDMVLSICGLLAIRRHSAGDPSWRGLAAFSLALTFCAGFMAICFWTIRLDFDPSWWSANLFLTIWPLFFLRKLGSGASAE